MGNGVVFVVNTVIFTGNCRGTVTDVGDSDTADGSSGGVPMQITNAVASSSSELIGEIITADHLYPSSSSSISGGILPLQMSDVRVCGHHTSFYRHH